MLILSAGALPCFVRAVCRPIESLSVLLTLYQWYQSQVEHGPVRRIHVIYWYVFFGLATKLKLCLPAPLLLSPAYIREPAPFALGYCLGDPYTLIIVRSSDVVLDQNGVDEPSF